jgi:hypothetical protein
MFGTRASLPARSWRRAVSAHPPARPQSLGRWSSSAVRCASSALATPWAVPSPRSARTSSAPACSRTCGSTTLAVRGADNGSSCVVYPYLTLGASALATTPSRSCTTSTVRAASGASAPARLSITARPGVQTGVQRRRGHAGAQVHLHVQARRHRGASRARARSHGAESRRGLGCAQVILDRRGNCVTGPSIVEKIFL